MRRQSSGGRIDSTSPRNVTAAGHRWVILAILFLVRTAMGFQFQSVASAAPRLTGAFGIGYTEIGTLIGLYMLPGVIIALPGGIVAQRFRDKQVCAAGLALMIVGGAIFALGTSYGAAVAGRIISGFGAVLFSLMITKMVADWFAGREIVTAMGVMLASWPFGIAIALVTQAPLAIGAGWTAVMWSTVALCAVVLALVTVFYRSPDAPFTAAAGPDRGAERRPSPGALSLVALAGAIWGAFNVGLVVFFSFTPALLGEHDIAPIAAGTLVSFGLWASMPALPLGGWLAERSGYPGIAIVLFSAGAGVILLLLVVAPFPAVLCALLGIAIGPPAGAIMALPTRVLSSQQRAMGFGLFYTIYYIAMAIGPLVAGWCRDHWHSASAAVIFGAVLYGSILPLTFVFYAGLSAPRRLAAAAK